MDIVATIRMRLMDIDAVRTVVSSRVYADHLPQSPTLPAIVVQSVPGYPRFGQLRGGVKVRQARIQVTSIAVTREAAKALDDAVQGDDAGSGLSFWAGTMGSPSVSVQLCQPMTEPAEFYDPGVLRQYRVNRDFSVFYTQ